MAHRAIPPRPKAGAEIWERKRALCALPAPRVARRPVLARRRKRFRDRTRLLWFQSLFSCGFVGVGTGFLTGNLERSGESRAASKRILTTDSEPDWPTLMDTDPRQEN